MAKNITKTVSIETLVVDYKTNVRLATNYDLPAMEQSIIERGRIEDAIHARLCDNVVLRGNRRTLAGQKLVKDPTTSQEVVNNLKKVVVIFHDVTPGSAEELSIVLDHGSQKKLCKTEVLLSVWRLDRQFQSELQIINRLYFALAEYTKKPEKAVEASKIANLKERQDYLRSWLHGTVGNFMLAGQKMGEYVRQQMELTHMAEDGLLPAGVTVECKISRNRLTELSNAKTADSDAKKGGKGWTFEHGGEKFNELLEQFKAEDRGEVEKEKKSRPSPKELKDRANSFKSPAIRSALLVAAGETEHGKDLVELDDRMHRMQMVTDTLSKRLGEITDEKVVNLIKAIIGDGPAGEIELAINKIVGK